MPRQGNAVGRGFGLGFGGCLGVLAAIVLVPVLGLSTCVASLPDRGRSAPETTPAYGPPTPDQPIVVEKITSRRDGPAAVVSVSVRSGASTVVDVLIQCFVSVNDEPASSVSGRANDLEPGELRTIELMLAKAKNGTISHVCDVRPAV